MKRKIDQIPHPSHFSLLSLLSHLLLAGALLLLAPACDPLGIRGHGNLQTETRDEKDFHALKVGVPGTVEVRVDSVFKVEVTCEENIIQYLETVVDHGALKIYFNRDVYDVDNLKITVSAPSWDAFDIDGSADVDVPDAIAGSKLDLGISGSGNLKVFKATFNQIKSTISGSGNVNLGGSADDLNATISGSGDLDALNCPVKTATVNVSGSGNARVNVTESLNATVSGSGDIEYKGAPQLMVNISGSGTVRKI